MLDPQTAAMNKALSDFGTGKLPVIEAPPRPLTRSQLRRLAWLLEKVEQALAGKIVLRWSEGCRRPWGKLLERAGVVLVSKTALARQGHGLKRGAKPIGSAYFGAPISAFREFYVLGIQSSELPKASKTGAKS